MVQGIEHQVKGSSIVPVGGKLPYYLELQTDKLLDLLVVITRQNDNDKNLRTKINKYLYSKTRPGYYLEINEHLHLAYADGSSVLSVLNLLKNKFETLAWLR